MTQIKRPHYFKGQFLKADDFIDEQQYHMQMRRLHNSSLHTWGIVDGLNVTAADAGIKISPGSAIDSQGREIWFPVSDDKTPARDTNFSIPPSTANGSYFVVLAYKEDYDSDSPYPKASPSDPNEYKFIRKIETGEPGLIAAAPQPSNEAGLLKLALVNIAAGKVTGTPDMSVRRSAVNLRANGVHLEICSLTKSGALRFKTGSPLSDRLTINADGKVGIGINEPKETLDVGGDIRLDIHKLYFTDKNHGIGVYGAGNKFKDTDINGPVLHGFGGGALAINQDWPTGLIQTIALRWNDKGNVGIATTDPVAALQVRPAPANVGNARFFNGVAALFSCKTDNGGNSTRDPETVMVLAREGVEGQSYANFARFDLDSYDKKTQLNIRLSHDSLSTEADQTPVIMALRSNANVGIGTTNPTATLQVGKTGVSEGSPSVRIGWGANNNEDRLTIYTTDEYRMGLRRGSRDLRIFAKSPDNDGHIYLMPNDTVAMSLMSSGTVNIGTLNPQFAQSIKNGERLVPLRGDFSPITTSIYFGPTTSVSGVNRDDWVVLGDQRMQVAEVYPQAGGVIHVKPPGYPGNAGNLPLYLVRPGPPAFTSAPESTQFTVVGVTLFAGDSSVTGTLRCWGDIIANGSIQGDRKDVAEKYLSDQDLAPGDLVCLDPRRDMILRSEKANDTLVIGVVSTDPAVLLNGMQEENKQAGTLAYPVALCGRVPCKVTDENGQIKRGDLLTSSSTPGHAMKAIPVMVGGVEIYRSGTIIGKALESHTSGKGLIEVFVVSR